MLKITLIVFAFQSSKTFVVVEMTMKHTIIIAIEIRMIVVNKKIHKIDFVIDFDLNMIYNFVFDKTYTLIENLN